MLVNLPADNPRPSPAPPPWLATNKHVQTAQHHPSQSSPASLRSENERRDGLGMAAYARRTAFSAGGVQLDGGGLMRLPAAAVGADGATHPTPAGSGSTLPWGTYHTYAAGRSHGAATQLPTMPGRSTTSHSPALFRGCALPRQKRV